MITDDSRMQQPVPIAIENPELVSYRAEFPILQRKTYMNSCSLGALSQRSMQNVAQFMEMWNEWGAHAWYEIWLGEIARMRQKFAKLIGAQLHEVAIAASVSAALSSIATALDYSKRNKVVMADMDFPTLAYQWLVKERLGVQCHFVESPDRVYVPPDLFEPAVDDKTALLATSHVFFTMTTRAQVRFPSMSLPRISTFSSRVHSNGSWGGLDSRLSTSAKGYCPICGQPSRVGLVTATNSSLRRASLSSAPKLPGLRWELPRWLRFMRQTAAWTLCKRSVWSVSANAHAT